MADVFTWIREVIVAPAGHQGSVIRIGRPGRPGARTTRSDVLELRRAPALAAHGGPHQQRSRELVEEAEWQAQRDTLKK